MDDDLNVSAAWAAVFEWVRDTNRQLADQTMTPVMAAAQLTAWEQVDAVLGVGLEEQGDDIPEEILSLADQRQQARKDQNWAEADRLRDELKSKGWVIEDTPNGPRPKRI
jgi:cysteinyl-tRNA synthetase